MFRAVRSTSLRGVLALVLGVVSLAVAYGCGGKNRPGVASTTSADAVPVDDAMAVQRERDQARKEALQYQEEVARLQAEVQSSKDRDALAQRAWAAVYDADSELKSLQDDAKQAATTRQKQSLDAAIADLREKRGLVERDARKIPSQQGAAWLRFQGPMTRSIDDLQRAIAEHSRAEQLAPPAGPDSRGP
jgi:hypothetical protein